MTTGDAAGSLRAGAGALTEMLGLSRCLLLDFDGPVCAVFATLPADEVTARVCGSLSRLGLPVPASIAGSADPLLVLRHAATVGGPALVRRVERTLSTAEREAVASARPTRYAREVIVAASRSGRRVGVVSNNGAGAIREYLADHGLTDHVHMVVGRHRDDPGLMKPHPAPVLAALAQLGAVAAGSVLIGDSVADIEAARAAGVASVGYANRPDKVHRLTRAGADVVVTDLAEVLAALSPSGRPTPADAGTDRPTPADAGTGSVGADGSVGYTGGCGSYWM